MAGDHRKILNPSLLSLLSLILLPFFTPVFATNTEWNFNKNYENPSIKGPVIGIDLGNSYSRVAFTKNGTTTVLPNAQGHLMTPSYVTWTEEGILVGEAAKARRFQYPESTFFNFVHDFGGDPSDVQDTAEHSPFKVMDPVNQKPIIYPSPDFKVGEIEKFSAGELVGLLFKEMKAIAENALEEKVENAVVAVPAHFDEVQRAAIKEAGQIANLEILRVIDGSRAINLAYGIDKDESIRNSFYLGDWGYWPDVKYYLVYDLGGTAFGATVLEVDEHVVRVLGRAEELHLGGQNFTQQLLDSVAEEIIERTMFDVSKDMRVLEELQRKVERAKLALSVEDSTHFSLNDLDNSYLLVTRERFENVNAHLFAKTIMLVDEALKAANLSSYHINGILLSGGSSNMPKIQSVLEEHFSIPPHKSAGFKPDEAMVTGAALLGDMLASDAAIEAKFRYNLNDFTIGIETLGGLSTPMIRRGNPLPQSKSAIFTTTYDNQTEVLFKIYVGERSLVMYNILLGTLTLSDIPAAPRGVARVEVTFVLNEDETLNATAIDQGSGMSKTIIIERKDGLVSEAHGRMIKEWLEHGEHDRAIRFYINNEVRGDAIHGRAGRVKLVSGSALSWID